MSTPLPYLGSGAETYQRASDGLFAPLTTKSTWRWWWYALGLASFFTFIFLLCVALVFGVGIGVLGNNNSNVWGSPLGAYEWWMAVGQAGLLISALLVLTRHPARTGLSRIAEAMALLASAIGGTFPIIHLGRPIYFLWLTPYPNSMGLWPQWRSSLIWDFWGILSFLVFAFLFWYVGAVPDFAALRERSHTVFWRSFYGVLAMGWNNSARQWMVHRRVSLTLAALAVPVVVLAHSVVGLDFAASLMPGWAEGIYPVYYVTGCFLAGSAMLLVLASLVRWGMSLEAAITDAHFDLLARFILIGSCGMCLCFATQWFNAWYAGDYADRSLVASQFLGYYAPAYWAMLLCLCIVPQLLWWPKLRRARGRQFIIAVVVLLGVWVERLIDIFDTLSHGYLSSMWHPWDPTLVDWGLMIGSVGFFALLFLLYCRLMPLVASDEARRLVHRKNEFLAIARRTP